ncbi:MAG: type II toxin-antitoxin system death-on-curing family toxin [Pseudomonadota bacterium]
MTWADALRGHDEALEDGGRAGIVNEHAIHSAIARPYHGYHRRIHQKSAALLEGIVRNHGFADANKRTALYLVELLITRSGYTLVEDDLVIVELIVSVADGQLSYDELANWFEPRIHRPAA